MKLHRHASDLPRQIILADGLRGPLPGAYQGLHGWPRSAAIFPRKDPEGAVYFPGELLTSGI